MVRYNEIREGEVAVAPPPPTDAGLVFIGRIRTPWSDRLKTPRQGRHGGPICRIEIFDPWVPALKGIADAGIASVCTQRGINAKALAARLGAASCTTDYRDVLQDDAVNAVIVGTRHDLHAEIVLAALRAGKHVFVEKPLCLTEEELDEIAALYAGKTAAGLRLK